MPRPLGKSRAGTLSVDATTWASDGAPSKARRCPVASIPSKKRGVSLKVKGYHERERGIYCRG
eukprot:scaffold28985_cov31-Tisochrysis_lutea.AAC.3